MYNVKNEKTILREQYKQRRLAMDPAVKAAYDAKITENLCKTMTYLHAEQILLYSAQKTEIPTTAIFDRAISDGKRCLYPKCLSDGVMDYYYIDRLDQLAEGRFRLMEPVDISRTYQPSYTDVCLIPAFAFDECGFRLGYGKGYYDRFLVQFPGVKVGLCYADFVERLLPRNRYDASVDILITEKGLYKLKSPS